MPERKVIFPEIRRHMQEVLAHNRRGMRAKELADEIHRKMPGELHKTIWARLSVITDKYPNQFVKISQPGAAFYYLRDDESASDDASSKDKTVKNEEKRFYEPFAEYLQYGKKGEDRLNECTKAIPLGGKVFGEQWTTPDVIGLFEPKRTSVVHFPTEVVSAEIKTDDTQIMHAFGQACAYRLFSHKTYLVVPESVNTARIVELCRVLGLGLVYLDLKAEKQDPVEQMFDVKLLAQKHAPNMFYLNHYMSKIANSL